MNRTWIFIPGNQTKHIDKAPTLSADNIIFDLEDSVASEEKEGARHKIKKAINELETKARKFVRVNEINSPYFLDDISAVVSQKLDGLVIPKVNGKEDIQLVDYLIAQFEARNDVKAGSISLIPLIETGKGMHHAYEIAKASDRIEALAFGAEDFMLDMSIPKDEGNALLMARSNLVMFSNAAGIQPPIDGVYTDIHHQDGLQKATNVAKSLGFQGKLIIHPKQLEAVNNIFLPTESELRKARKIVEAYEASQQNGIGAIQVDGKMIDVPVAERAKRLLENVSV
ncbi:HpcH/HpaI aldolase/citrate lyase family protein [Oceanobacillus damuensis]|uniref:HpcH/HpaI aldolase/citrate lyase family protein n=1 Tax=Oceanobacillus damuensis TaxID=937928 RepID=UPI000830304C|nr:CoA ester lyase [Oceanobacillus damuensis]